MQTEKEKKEFMKDVIQKTIAYCQSDYDSYLTLVGREGDGSVGMIAQASALIDLVALIYTGKSKSNSQRISDMIGRIMIHVQIKEWISPSISGDLIQDIIRNGVVHQFYGRATLINRDPDSMFILCKSGNDYVINPDGYYLMAVHYATHAIDQTGKFNKSQIDKSYLEFNQKFQFDEAALKSETKNLTINTCRQGSKSKVGSSAVVPKPEPTSPARPKLPKHPVSKKQNG